MQCQSECLGCCRRERYRGATEIDLAGLNTLLRMGGQFGSHHSVQVDSPIFHTCEQTLNPAQCVQSALELSPKAF
jgi:hypothetical protein